MVDKLRVAIIGGSGFIGKALTHELLAAGHGVRIISRGLTKAPSPAGVEQIQWDARTGNGLANALAGVDCVVNLAGENIGARLWTVERKKQILESRLVIGSAITAALRTTSTVPRMLVQASAIGYYGLLDDRVVTEKDPAGSDYLAGVAVRWEESTRAVEEMGVRRVVIRSGLVFDKDEGTLPRFILPFRLMVGGPLGSGKQWVSWIHIEDETRAIRFLIENEQASGAYNLTTPDPATNADFGRVLARVMGRPYWMPAPSFALRMALGEMSTLVLGGQRVIPQRLQQAGFQFTFPELQSALKNILRA